MLFFSVGLKYTQCKMSFFPDLCHEQLLWHWPGRGPLLCLPHRAGAQAPQVQLQAAQQDSLCQGVLAEDGWKRAVQGTEERCTSGGGWKSY